MAGTDHATGERILAEFRPSGAAYMNVLDISGSTGLLVMAQRAPWRAIGIGLTGLGLAWLVGAPETVTVLVLTLFGGLAGLEIWHRRDFLTPSRVVRQSGLLGRRRVEVPLIEIESVEYFYPRFGEHFNAGDVEVRAPGTSLTFSGVAAPQELARAILDARAALVQ